MQFIIKNKQNLQIQKCRPISVGPLNLGTQDWYFVFNFPCSNLSLVTPTIWAYHGICGKWKRGGWSLCRCSNLDNRPSHF